MTWSSKASVDKLRDWHSVILLIGVMALVQMIGPVSFRYETRLIDAGEWWRLLTGHWVHANWTHFGMNMIGLVLCQALTGVKWPIWAWLWRILLLGFVISLGFWLWQPQVNWYVGFSGVLYGLYVLAAVASWPQQRGMSFILLSLIVVKIALEQLSPVDVTSSELIGVPVLVDAHFYGVLCAFIVAGLMLFIKRYLAHEPNTVKSKTNTNTNAK